MDSALGQARHLRDAAADSDSLQLARPSSSSSPILERPYSLLPTVAAAATAATTASGSNVTPSDEYAAPNHSRLRQGSIDQPQPSLLPPPSDACPPDLMADSTTIGALPPPPPPPLPVPEMEPFYAIVSDYAASAFSPSSSSAPFSSSLATAPSTTIYPRVRYIFNDDDPDILSSALSAQHAQVAAASTAAAAAPPPSTHEADEYDGAGGGQPAAPAATERAILLDLVPRPSGRGYDVASATSLSADWAVTGVRLSRLGATPSSSAEAKHNRNDSNGNNDHNNSAATAAAATAAAASEEDGTLVLTIDGTNVLGAGTSASAADGGGGGGGSVAGLGASQLTSKRAMPLDTGGSGLDGSMPPSEDYATVIAEFDSRMSFLRKTVVQASEHRKSRLQLLQAGPVQEAAAAEVENGHDVLPLPPTPRLG